MDNNSRQKLTFQPTANQIRFLDLYLDFSQKRTLTAIADELEIARQTIYNWLEDENFVKWLNTKKNEILAKSLMARYITAIRKAIAGDFSYSKLLFEMEKEYIPAISHNISIKVTEIVITHVVEVINKFIEDDNLKRKIGEELTRINFN